MALIVAKFGGTSLGSVELLHKAAAKIVAEKALGHSVVVVVSAMAGVTNQLVEYCRDISAVHDAREYDMVVSSGEQVNAGLMAIALQAAGVQARSWLGWQVPIRTDDQYTNARITDIPDKELLQRISHGEVPVIAGFQGVSARNRITTLGRGGSDTTAVAIAAALKADRCDIYTDVDGVFTTDPRIVPQAKKLKEISYEEMLEMSSLGAKVLKNRSIEIAMKFGVPVQVLSAFRDAIGSDLPGTQLVNEGDMMEHAMVNGITYTQTDAKITLHDVLDQPGIAARIFSPLADVNINVDMIVQNISENGTTDVTFTVPKADMQRAITALEESRGDIDYQSIHTDTDIAKISIIGVGMNSHTGVAILMFKTLAAKGINIKVISTSEIKISVLIPSEYTELAIRSLHTAYGLDDA